MGCVEYPGSMKVDAQNGVNYIGRGTCMFGITYMPYRFPDNAEFANVPSKDYREHLFLSNVFLDSINFLGDNAGQLTNIPNQDGDAECFTELGVAGSLGYTQSNYQTNESQS